MSMLLSADPSTRLVLVVRKAHAARYIQDRIQQGRDIKAQRIRSQKQLDSARQYKTAWVGQTMELLTRVFSDKMAAEYFNDWSPEVLPEYAPLEAFVEAFYAEINHRLQRLKNILKYVTDSPENESLAPETAPEPAAAVSASAEDFAAPADAELVDLIAPPPVLPEPQPEPAPTPAAPAPAPVATAAFHPNPSSRSKAPAKVLLVFPEADDAAAQAVADLVLDLGLEPARVVASSDARTLCAELDQHRNATFAIVYASADSGGAGTDPNQFVLGFAVGRFGAARVAMLSPDQQQVLSAEAGLCSIPLDAPGAWQLHLAKQMKRAGLAVDLNRLC